MKKLISLDQFNSKKIEANVCNFITGGVDTKRVTLTETSYEDTDINTPCPDEKKTVRNHYNDGQVCAVISTYGCC